MDIVDIQHEIDALSIEQQAALLDWLTERDRLRWDGEIERDFSSGGLGGDLLDQVKAQVQRGASTPMAKARQRR